MRRSALFALPLALFAGLLVFAASGLYKSGGEGGGMGALLGAKPPFAAAWSDLTPPARPLGPDAWRREGREGTAGAGGAQLRLVNFFASWCAPCHAEHATFTRLAGLGEPAEPASFARLDLAGLVWRDRDENITAWLAEEGNPFAWLGRDEGGALGRALGVTGVPTSFLLVRGHEGGGERGPVAALCAL